MKKKCLFFVFILVYTFPSLLVPLVPQLYWNSTDSGPKGVYLQRDAGSIRRGEKVVFDVPKEILKESFPKDLKRVRPLIKTVAALSGDKYCIKDSGLYIEGRWTGPVFTTSSTNQPLPVRRGCFVVQQNHFLPISTYHPRSFDGRYFGEVSFTQIRGEAVPVLTYD